MHRDRKCDDDYGDKGISVRRFGWGKLSSGAQWWYGGTVMWVNWMPQSYTLKNGVSGKFSITYIVDIKI